MRRARSGVDGGIGEKKAKILNTVDEMRTPEYWTLQCDMATRGITGVRLMTSSDWIEHYDVKGKNSGLFQGFVELYRRFNEEGLGKVKTEIPSIEDLDTCPLLCDSHRHGFYDGVAVYFVLVQERDGERPLKSKPWKVETVKAGWPLAFALVFRFWPRPEIPQLKSAQTIWEKNDKELLTEKNYFENLDVPKMNERLDLTTQDKYVRYMQEKRRLPLTYFNHLAADARFAGFGTTMINMLKGMFRNSVICLEISIDDEDKYSESRRRDILNLMGYYERLGFIRVSDLKKGLPLRDYLIRAYLCAWLRIQPSDLGMRNIFDSNPTNGKWMVLARDNDFAPEKLGLFRSHAKGGR